MPILGDPGHRELIQFLKGKARDWLLGDATTSTSRKPKAIIVVTAHWETAVPMISAVEAHHLLYDYYGFPKAAYNLTFPAKGDIQISKEVERVLKEAGIDCKLDSSRGLDHGVFIPLLTMMEGKENIFESVPIIALSVLENQRPSELIKYGKALSLLRDQDIAIIGSGMTFHNMQSLMNGGSKSENAAFEADLLHILNSDPIERLEKLEKWEEIPFARSCHPLQAAEHFSPYLVVAAAGGSDPVKEVFKMQLMGFQIHSFVF